MFYLLVLPKTSWYLITLLEAEPESYRQTHTPQSPTLSLLHSYHLWNDNHTDTTPLIPFKESFLNSDDITSVQAQKGCYIRDFLATHSFNVFQKVLSSSTSIYKMDTIVSLPQLSTSQKRQCHIHLVLTIKLSCNKALIKKDSKKKLIRHICHSISREKSTQNWSKESPWLFTYSMHCELATVFVRTEVNYTTACVISAAW